MHFSLRILAAAVAATAMVVSAGAAMAHGISAQGYSQNAGLVFIGSARRGNIGPGVFDEVYGGEAFDEGALAFGMKGGC